MTKKGIILILGLIALFHTEGAIAQGVFQKKDLQPAAPDSLFMDETDTLTNITTTEPQRHHVSHYAEAQKQYLSQPLESKNIDKNKWEEAKKGIDYSDDIIKKKQSPTTTSIKPDPIWGTVFELLKWFFIIGAVVLLAFLILRFLGEGNVFGTKKRRIADPSVSIDLEHIEENLDTAELDPLIKQAIADKNFTLAIRLYYLAILKELYLKGDIAWKKDKTNRAYVIEMRNHRFFEPFRNMTTTFERVWYGSQIVDEYKFALMQPDFQNLLKSLR